VTTFPKCSFLGFCPFSALANFMVDHFEYFLRPVFPSISRSVPALFIVQDSSFFPRIILLSSAILNFPFHNFGPCCFIVYVFYSTFPIFPSPQTCCEVWFCGSCHTVKRLPVIRGPCNVVLVNQFSPPPFFPSQFCLTQDISVSPRMVKNDCLLLFPLRRVFSFSPPLVSPVFGK